MAHVYQSKQQTEAKLQQLFQTMVRDGSLLLPTETELASLVGASRRVVREVLQELELSGKIIHEGRRRALVSPVLSGLARFSFLTVGFNLPVNLTWAKLWSSLQHQASQYGLIAEPCFFNHLDTSESLERKLQESSDLVVATMYPSDVSLPDGWEEKTVICTDRHFKREQDNFIGLNNVDVGKLAALELHAHGYRKPCLMSIDLWECDWVHGYEMYAERVRGFVRQCGALNVPLSLENDFFYLQLDRHIEKKLSILTQFAAQLHAGGYDSLFVVCDNDIAIIYDILVSRGFKIPQDLGLITVNSFDYAIQHNPPISAISTGTRELAKTLLTVMHNLKTSPIKGQFSLSVTPKTVAGSTLRT